MLYADPLQQPEISSTTVGVIVNVVKSVAMGLVFWLLWTIRNVFIVGWNIHKFVRRFEEMIIAFEKAKIDIEKLTARLDQGGKKMSDLTTEIQGLPQTLSDDFITRREYDALNLERDRYRKDTRGELDRAWEAIDRRALRR